MMDEAFMRLSSPLEQGEKNMYIRALRDIGGDKVINYFIKHFSGDESGYSGSLMLSVRTQRQANRVHEFLLKELAGWEEVCRRRHYVLQEFKKFGVQYGFDAKAMPCTSHDRFCYVRPLGIAGLGLVPRCETVECAWSGGYR